MKQRYLLKLCLTLVFSFLISFSSFAQGVEKVMFLKPVPVKIQSKDTYSFTVGYIANQNRDINIELTSKSLKYFANNKIAVKKGQGIIEVDFAPPEAPIKGDDYRIMLSLRESKGGWKTTKAATIINKIEIVEGPIRFSDKVSFSPITPFSMESTDSFSFDVDYSVAKENLVQVSIWNDREWLGTSKRTLIQPGNGTQNVVVKMDAPVEGNKYRFMLTFGTKEEFASKNTKSKERSGIQITKPAKKLTLKEINAKSVQLAINKDSEILTLPGKSSYEFIKIIAMNGQILGEVNNTNSINISKLTQGAYFAITSEEDYYKFVKL